MLKGWVEANGPITLGPGTGRREVGWKKKKPGEGRSFKLYEPEDAPDSPFDERLAETLRHHA